jgi:DNA mismatch repair ATPase MutS
LFCSSLLALTPKAVLKTANLGLSWCDLSSGEFFSQSSHHLSIEHDLARIQPSEIILCTNTANRFPHLEEGLKQNQWYVTKFGANSEGKISIHSSRYHNRKFFLFFFWGRGGGVHNSPKTLF